MKLKGDQNTTRALNRRLVLNCLRREGALSRVDIIAMTGLSPAAISGVVGELIKEGFVIEGEVGRSSGGRKPILVSIDYGCRYSLGLKLTQGRLEATLTDLSTTPIGAWTVLLSEQTPAAVAAAARQAVEHLLPDESERRKKLIGVGLAMPGLIDVKRGVCLVSHRFGWRDVPIAALLAAQVKAPVWVDNDVNAFAIAQQLFGHGRLRASVLVLIIGTGVGAALIINGQIHHGARFAAGEIGFAVEEGHGNAAAESRRSWEQLFSEPAMVRAWGQIRESGSSDPLPAADLELAAAQGDPRANAYLNKVGHDIGLRLVTMIDLIDPEVVIVGGEAIRFGSPLVEPIISIVRECCFETPPPVEIDWENNVWSRGASALAIQQFFDFESTGAFENDVS
ncbi:ROK family protein [Rhizobium sp. RCC_161_2]|uniref:ROK family transcriptional regulator n=1 Tax=Rhizobium sp. RCC_161_2 TaxID=3239219 RepID=UPI0035264EE1